MPNVKVQMSIECQSSKWDSEINSEWHHSHAELVSASHLTF